MYKIKKRWNDVVAARPNCRGTDRWATEVRMMGKGGADDDDLVAVGYSVWCIGKARVHLPFLLLSLLQGKSYCSWQDRWRMRMRKGRETFAGPNRAERALLTKKTYKIIWGITNIQSHSSDNFGYRVSLNYCPLSVVIASLLWRLSQKLANAGSIWGLNRTSRNIEWTKLSPFFVLRS